MSSTTFEGVVDGDRIRLADGVHLPNRAKVYVVVPGPETKIGGQILSPPDPDPLPLRALGSGQELAVGAGLVSTLRAGSSCYTGLRHRRIRITSNIQEPIE